MKVLFTDYQYENIDQEVEIISNAGYEIVDLEKDKSKSLEEIVEEVDAIIVQYANINRALIERMKKCKMIIKYGIGVNNIDVEAATEKNIYVCNVPDYGIDEVSNHAIAMLFALHKKLPIITKNLRNGDWSYDTLIPIKRMEGSTLGLIGFGRIPQMLAKKMKGFNLNIIAYDPYVKDEIFDKYDVKKVDLETICKNSDFISLHCALTKDTLHMIGENEFNLMKENSIVINTARGPIIKEEALIEALKNGKIAGAGLDTFENEPIDINNELLKMDNVICTPHCAWYSIEAIKAVQRKAAEEVVNVLKGNKPFNSVNKL